MQHKELLFEFNMACIPPHWESNKRKSVSSTVDSSARNGKRTKVSDNDQDNLQIISSIVSAQMKQEQRALPVNLDVKSLLDTIPFVKLLQDVTMDDTGVDIPLVTKVYEEQYMRESFNDKELSCVMGSQCECMLIDRNQPFIGTQFILPSEKNTPNNMCVLCLRKTTQMLFYYTIHAGHVPNAVIQKHGNICNEPGEYHRAAMLICPPNGPVHCMPIPIVAHQRNQYSVVERGGVHWIKQHNVYFEDFT